jgi:pimeloyl-ACP methyl ester carboxylesterase
LVLCGVAYADDMPFARAPEFKFTGPTVARGALLWIHGTYGRDQTGPPPPPDFVGREAATGLDIWCFNRDRGDDPLARGAEILARGVKLLRGMGYRRVIVAGHSRGAWIALSILAHPGLADAVVAFDPAAHGRGEDGRAQAMTDWSALWQAAVIDGTRVVLVQLADDAWDPDPARRLAIARDRAGDHLLSIFRPDAPKGHAGVYDPMFDTLFGEQIESYVQ